VTLDRLHLHRLRLGWNDGPVLTSADIDVQSVYLPLPDWVWSVAVARGAQGRRLQAPSLAVDGLESTGFRRCVAPAVSAGLCGSKPDGVERGVGPGAC